MTPVFILAHALTLCAPVSTQQPGEPIPLVAMAEPVSTAPFSAQEREELRAAQQQAPELTALRAGSGPTNEEWKWIAIGALAVVVLIIIF